MRKKIVFQCLTRNSWKLFPTEIVRNGLKSFPKTKERFQTVPYRKLVPVLILLSFILFFNWQALAVGTAFTYQGRLTDGSTPVNVPQDFQFKVFNAVTGGTQIGSTLTKSDVPVTNGLFVVELDFGSNVFTGYSRYLEIYVRPGTSTGSYTLLTPRQKINPTPYAILARSSEALKLPYDETIDSPTCAAFSITNTTGYAALEGVAKGAYGSGVHGYSDSTYGIGVYGYSNGTDGEGVRAYSLQGNGIYVLNAGKEGIYINSAGSSGVFVNSAGECGVRVNSADQCGISIISATLDGVRVESANWSGIYVESSGFDALRVSSAGQDGLRFFENVTRDYIRAGSDADLDFRVLNTGEVQSDAGYTTPAADFAEMIEVEGNITQYEPGDVLVISEKQNRAVTLSSKSYSSAIIGVYSTAPGFVGGKPVAENNTTNKVPVAVMGIVPCKVSAENGSIARGDLLVTSSIKGYAMRTDNPKSGTLLGKAMESLDKNKGVISILVTLQ